MEYNKIIITNFSFSNGQYNTNDSIIKFIIKIKYRPYFYQHFNIWCGSNMIRFKCFTWSKRKRLFTKMQTESFFPAGFTAGPVIVGEREEIISRLRESEPAVMLTESTIDVRSQLTAFYQILFVSFLNLFFPFRQSQHYNKASLFRTWALQLTANNWNNSHLFFPHCDVVNTKWKTLWTFLIY